MKFLTREEFRNPTELKTKEVPTPELGDDTGVIMRELGAAARMRLLREFGEGVKLDGPAAVELRAKILRESLVDVAGELLCPDAEDLDVVLGHDLDLVIRLGDEAMALSGITGEDEDATEEAVKNSESED